jgi:hypothetical protein
MGYGLHRDLKAARIDCAVITAVVIAAELGDPMQTAGDAEVAATAASL